MFTKISVTLLFLASVFAGEMTISTPAALIQCQPVQIKWDGGMAPYFLAAIPGGQPSAPALKDFGKQDVNSLVWNVDLPAGTSVTLRLTDSAGTVNYAQAVTIQPGSSTSCGGGSIAAAAAPAADNNASTEMMSSMAPGMPSMPASSSSSMMGSAMSMSMSGSPMMSSTSMSSSPTGMPTQGASSMSRSSMSRSAVSSASARPSSASKDADDSDSANAATVLMIAKSGAIAFLVGTFAIAWF